MDPDVEIMFVTDVGMLIPKEKTTVCISREFNRQSLPEDEASISKVWASRLQENPRLFNGTKFRVHSASREGAGTVTLNLGLTDYRQYLGTNWAPWVGQLQARGQQELSNPQAYLSDPLGVGAFVVTSDDCVIFLKRSLHCAEAPAMWDIPGGHAEPQELVGRASLEQIDIHQMEPSAVAQEIFHSILREVRDEVNIPEEHLSEALLMGIAKNTTSAGRPSLEFLVRCSLSKEQVLHSYRQGSQSEADESTSIMLLPVSTVVSLQTSDPALWSQVAPSAKGCIFLYNLALEFRGRRRDSPVRGDGINPLSEEMW
ncbi:uridine diphosphate glucose pyrophosphatase NUDT22-like [Babylonia areolata]|uniref:uridine diphosphate glucose pyrophosphatase NUDT22-like n=1 Tax=Babylonia areolata TaxID=304850 RepID=UPI003FD01B8F